MFKIVIINFAKQYLLRHRIRSNAKCNARSGFFQSQQKTTRKLGEKRGKRYQRDAALYTRVKRTNKKPEPRGWFSFAQIRARKYRSSGAKWVFTIAQKRSLVPFAPPGRFSLAAASNLTRRGRESGWQGDKKPAVTRNKCAVLSAGCINWMQFHAG